MNSEGSWPPARVPRVGRRWLLLRVSLSFFVSALSLVLVLELFPGLGGLDDRLSALWVVVILAILQVVLWPVFVWAFLRLFYKVSAGFMCLAFPAFSLLLMTLLTMGASALYPHFVINGFAAAFLIALLLTVVSMIIASIFSIEDEPVIYHGILRTIKRRAVRTEDIGRPGLIFIEIDGLGEKVLREAMARGKMANLKRWIDSGSHRLIGWVSDLSSQTSAAQAGILHGNNFDIPAFRWYDRVGKRLVVSSSINDLTELEKKVTNGDGLLHNGGACRGCLLSGDASHVLLTASRVFGETSAELSAYYLNPFGLVRSLWLVAWDIVLEKKSAWLQWLRNEQPRVNRGGIYVLFRALLAVLVKDFALATLRGDMYSGAPCAYVSLAGYDEVSHHSGVNSSDALEILRKLDREFGKLEWIGWYAPRRYRFVILSDHGQSQGRTFLSRYGERLEDLVSRLLNHEDRQLGVASYETRHESAYYIDAALGHSGGVSSGVGRQLRGALDNSKQIRVGSEADEDVVVLASGNLGLIFFTFADYRLALEEMAAMFPDLVPGLVEHPGVGFVMVRSKERGPVVLGKNGRVYLDGGLVEGENPLTDYGPHTASLVSREDSFPNAPDILLVSTYWRDTDEVAPFEEHLGSHGGIGGDQSRPFILYPSELDPGDDPLVGAEQVYRVFKRWIAEYVSPGSSLEGDTRAGTAPRLPHVT